MFIVINDCIKIKKVTKFNILRKINKLFILYESNFK